MLVSLYLLIALAEPSLETLLRHAAEYAESYPRRFRQFVAREERTQIAYDRKAKPHRKSTVSDYYVVSLPSAPEKTVEFRETLLVDGKRVNRKPGRILELLTQKSENAESELARIRQENNRYALAAFKRHFVPVNSALAFLTREVQSRTKFELVRMEPSAGRSAAVVHFRESGGDAVHSINGAKAPAEGTLYLTVPDGRLIKAEYVCQKPGSAVRTAVEYEAEIDGLLLPAHYRDIGFNSDFDRPKPNTWGTEVRYGNYRRFTVDVKITPDLTP